MFRKTLLIPIIALAVLSLACRVTVDLPIDRVTIGKTRSEEIKIPAPDAAVVDLKINFDAGELKIAPGAAAALVEGTATYNVADLKPEVEVDGSEVRLSTGVYSFEGIPKFDDRNVVNKWDIMLGSQQINLTLSAGAYEGSLELGGLALRSLYATNGAAKVDMSFSSPNKTEMSTLQYQTGASDSNLAGLSNANFSSMIFRGGAGDYTLDFSGELKRDASVMIDAGIGQVTLIVPEGLATEVIFQGGLARVDADREWEKSGDLYTLEGSGPRLTITVKMGAGELRLKTTVP